jgi:PPP family 3-phenylpropionic acid transporter
VIAEVVLFAMSGRVLAMSGTARLLGLAGGAAVLRWGFMAFDPALWATGLLQILHAMTFGAAHLAAIHFLTHAVPEDRGATAQGLYAAVVAGLVMGSLTLACGPLYRMFGGEAYGVMAGIAVIGTVAAFMLQRHWHGGLIVGDQPHNSDDGGKTEPAS